MHIETIREKVKTLDKKIIFGISIAAALAVLGIGTLTFGKSSREPLALKEEPPVSVAAVTVEPKTVDAVVSAAGGLSSRNSSVLSSKVMGRVAAVTVNEGDHVAQGKLLMKIESGEIAAQAYQARAAYDNAKLNYERIKTLFDEEAATQMEMDQATLGFESAKAGLNAAKAMESYTTITAPISGQIVEKRVNPGEMAVPGQPLLKIEDNRNLRLEVSVKEQDIRFVKTGQSAAVRIDALPDRTITGRIAQVVPAADTRTHSFMVKIDIPADNGLITGMYGKAFFIVGKREAIFVPRAAVVEMAGLTGVYIVSREGSAVFQTLQPGEMQGDSVEAISGLKAGDRVIVNPPAAQIDGRKVVVAEK